MSLITGMQPDFLSLDGFSYTLHQKRAGQDSALPIRNATIRPLSFSQIAALGGLQLNGGEQSISLNATDVGPAGVQPGDTIDASPLNAAGVSDGTLVFNVIAASLATMGTRWKCVGRKQE